MLTEALISQKTESLQTIQTASIPQKRKRGRPKKRRIKKTLGRKPRKRAFEETALGYLLKYEAPIEYSLILTTLGEKQAPSANFIEAISYASINPLFRKSKFRRALIEYRQHGLYSEHRNLANKSAVEYHQQVYLSQISKFLNGG